VFGGRDDVTPSLGLGSCAQPPGEPEQVCLDPAGDGGFGRFMRMLVLASVYTNHDPQPSNPNQVMVVVFSIELSAVD
jgi:hypothetical protein